LRHLFRAVAVVHTDYVLRDDRALVELVGDEVGGGADDFDAPIERLPVRIRADERRQKRVVNIHDPAVVAFHERRAQHPHVLREDEIVELVWAERPVQGFLVRLA
jgi:hypothetical protein